MSKMPGRLRRGKRDGDDGERSSSPSSPESVSAAVLDAALAGARREGMRLFTLQRVLFASAATGTALVALRGVYAIASPSGAGSVPFALGVLVTLVACGGLFAAAFRMRTRMERLTRDVHTLELARDALGNDAMPRVEIRPYRTAEGDERPVVVVRTDDVQRLFTKHEAPDARRPLPWVARALLAGVLGIVVVIVASVLLEGRPAGARHRWTFLDDASSPDVLGFQINAPEGGAWSLEHDNAATGARSLVNRVGANNAPPATLVSSSIRARDVHVGTRCRVSLDRTTGACGVVFRYTDVASYYVARIDIGAKRVVLARVDGGQEHVLATATATVQPTGWHELIAEARGDELRVFWNGRGVIQAHDARLASPGAVGLWAPSGVEAYFDELVVEVLPVSPQAVEVLPLLGRRTS